MPQLNKKRLNKINEINELNLMRRKLKTISNINIASWPNLITLNLNQNKIKSLADVINRDNHINNSAKIQKLKLSFNRIKYIDDRIRLFQNLKELYLSCNFIKTIHTNIKFLSNLEKIYLNHNCLNRIIDEIYMLKNLKELHIASNNIKIISNNIDELINLTVLNVSCNKIKILPTGLFKLINLVTLKLNNNKISTLPDEIGNLTSLEKLYLNHNLIKLIPTNLIHLKKINLLHLNHNKLIHIPLFLIFLPNISDINYDKCSYDSLHCALIRYSDKKIRKKIINEYDILCENKLGESHNEYMVNTVINFITHSCNENLNLSPSPLKLSTLLLADNSVLIFIKLCNSDNYINPRLRITLKELMNIVLLYMINNECRGLLLNIMKICINLYNINYNCYIDKLKTIVNIINSWKNVTQNKNDKLYYINTIM